MPGKKPVKPKQKRPLKKMFIRALLIALLTAVSLLILWMHICARTVRVRFAEVALGDLPSSFDGTQILYVSDADLCGLHTAGQVGRLFRGLQVYSPDILLLGGDYASANLFERLNGSDSEDETALRTAFFQAISDFSAPMGKFAISGDNDGDRTRLLLSMTGSGVELIDGDVRVLSKEGDAIAVVGIGPYTSDISAIASRFHSGQCVVALMHSPQQSVNVRIAEASNGGTWADLLLAGHTHGGQIRIGSRSLLTLTESEQNHLSGWYTDGRAPLLVTSGLGCEGVNLRLGTTGEVWLITLRSE